MRGRTALSIPALLTGLAVIAGTDDMARARTGPRSPDKIYATTCGYCHGHNIGPVLKGRHLPAQAVQQFVRRGQGAMPAFRQTEISDAELAALATWLEAAPADPKEHGQ